MQNNIKTVILAEINAVHDKLEYVFKNEIYLNKEELSRKYPTNTNYFKLLEANATKLEQIENKDLLNLIIEFYVSSKFFFDCISVNNELIDEHNQLTTQSDIDDSNRYLKEFKEKYLKAAYNQLSYIYDKITRLEEQA